MDYVVIIERAQDGSFSAYVPRLPGCVACGDTQPEVWQLIQEAIMLHLDSLRAHDDPIPAPTTTTAVVHAA